jgi:S-DNA-T family DNA segregation ATPase FtsK/SpoIIIE
VLEDFGVSGSSLGAKVGPVVTLHEFEPSAGTKASRVIGLADDIARSMSAISARIAVIPGKTSIGMELPNPKRQMIFLRELIENKEYKFSQFALPIILGKDISGEMMIADLAKMPHLLIAGTTGSGKSVGLNVMILSLLFRMRPDECKFIMIDPKMLELSMYDGIPHLLAPVVTEPAKAIVALKWVVAEMEERYRLMSSFAVRNIAGYNEKAEKAALSGEKLKRKVQTGYDPTNGHPIMEEIDFEPKKIPFIVVIVDEMADLMLVAGKEIEGSIQRLAQMARASGIHIIMATQRPSVDVITGVIKANFPTRISFQVTSRIDSRTILGVQGAEQLLGQGDMIHMSGGSKMTRVHGPFCSDTEIENVVNFIKDQDLSEFENDDKVSFEAVMAREAAAAAGGGDADSGFEAGSDEDLYAKAVAIVKRDRKPSISYVQRQLRIGYNRAAILIEKMEAEGVISAPNVSGKREILGEE